MISQERWKIAQSAENEFWSGISQDTIGEAIEGNQGAARLLCSWVPELPAPALEIGVGGLGIGLVAFLPDDILRIGTDPLPLVNPRGSSELVRMVLGLRESVHFIRATGENLPLKDRCIGLAVCNNVLDHVRDAPLVLKEIFRVLQPGGLLFLRVDTFSYLGLAKWHLWTQRVHANEILVRAHPYRFSETRVGQLCRGVGFEMVRALRRGLTEKYIGRSSRSSFLVRKPQLAI
jgi:SAM-dependent methyltransferase